MVMPVRIGVMQAPSPVPVALRLDGYVPACYRVRYGIFSWTAVPDWDGWFPVPEKKDIMKLHELHEDLKTWLADRELEATRAAADATTTSRRRYQSGAMDAYRAILGKIEELENHYE